jgi:coenzyme F420-reducing hydrogenase alpha subunit
MTETREISIKVPVLARVEGEGALDLEISDGQIQNLKLRIYEPPRYFEKFLEGRSYAEIPDIVARICGICPVAYQMSAVQAIESAFGCEPGPWVQAMRRLMYCGEWIESHALHIHLLAAPDFLGYGSITEMAADYPAEVRRGLRIQGLGNEIIRFLGGRSVHPVGMRAGGFYSAPKERDAAALRVKLEVALADAESLVRWVAGMTRPQHEQVFTSVAMHNGERYPIYEGRIITDQGLDCPIADFEQHFQEQQVPYSTALHCRLHGEPYLVGPLARLNLNHTLLPDSIQSLCRELGLVWPSRNMFQSIIARAIEIYFVLVEAICLLADYQQDTPYQEIKPKAAIGYGCTEAPRGLLWHRYEFNDRGDIVSARIVPPTSQNQARIEQDIARALQSFGLDKSDDQLRLQAEMVIRNYDPCISCSTHFLKLNVERF